MSTLLQNYTPDDVSDGVEPLTPLERLPQSAQDIFAEEEAKAIRDQSANDAHRLRMDQKRVDIAEVLTQMESNSRSAKPNHKLEEQLEAQEAKRRAELKAIEAKHEEEKRLRPGSSASFLRDFLNSPAAIKSYRAANTTDEPLPGKSPGDMVAVCRAEFQRLLAERKAILRAPKSRDEIEYSVHDLLSRYRADVPVGALRHVVFDEHLNRFKPRDGSLPEVSVADATGGLTRFGDGMGFLIALMGDVVTERMLALALKDHDESKALSMQDRVRRLAENDSAMTSNAYRSEFWFRHCVRSGINPGPRVGGGKALALAILDIVEA